MKVFVFKPSNEFIGKFQIEHVDELRAKLEQFLQQHQSTPTGSYLEVSGRVWTLIAADPLEFKEGRVSNPSAEIPFEGKPESGIQEPGKAPDFIWRLVLFILLTVALACQLVLLVMRKGQID